MSHHLLNWLANLSSDNEVAVVARDAACFAVGEHLRPILLSISQPMVLFYCLTFWILMGDGCRNSLVQELLELRLDCSSGLANSSDVGSDLATPADLQSGHRTTVSSEHRVALMSIGETFCALKPLSALFPSWYPVKQGSLLLIRTLFGVGVEV